MKSKKLKTALNSLITVLITLSLPLSSFSHVPLMQEVEVESSFRYRPAKTNKLIQGTSVELMGAKHGILQSTNKNAGVVEKSILLIKLANTMKDSMEKFHNLKCDADDILPGPCNMRCIKAPCPMPIGCVQPMHKKSVTGSATSSKGGAVVASTRPIRMPPRCPSGQTYQPNVRGCVPFPRPCVQGQQWNYKLRRCMPMPRPCNLTQKKAELSKATLKKVDAIEKKIDALPGEFQDVKLVAIVDLAKKLAINIKTANKNRPIHYDVRRGRINSRPSKTRSAPSRPSRPVSGGVMKKSMGGAQAGGRGLSVKAGGAQDMDFIRTSIKKGDVPLAENFLIEGMLSEHDLSFPSPKACKELLCVETASQATNNGKLFVQFEMNSNVTADNFKRDALNLSIVLDVSGSMGANDGTAHTRMEWGIRALKKAISKLNHLDTVSVVLFSSSESVLSKPITATEANKKALLAKVDAIQQGGGTNLESGLSKGFEFASELNNKGASGRVLLISDAGLNTGVVDEKVILKMVSDYAAEGVGLTAMGLGLNFKQDFINGITQSRGGNYVFVQDGQKMFKFFNNQFDFLVTPVAFDFKVQLKLKGAANAKLVKAYGVPMDKKSPIKTLVDIRSLFFSGEGSGGAVVLEYDL